MIIEGVMTTVNAEGELNVAPMGPIVNRELTEFLFRPFQTSTTFRNLKQNRCGVFHVVDDVELIARAAIGRDAKPETHPAKTINGMILSDACRWFELEVRTLDESDMRSEIVVDVVHHGELRPHFGFNRAKHAVIELAILATRLHLLDHAEILQQQAWLTPMVDKTGGDQEKNAFAMLSTFIAQRVSEGALNDE